MRPQAFAVSLLAMLASAQQVEKPVAPPPDPVAIMVGRLDLERYKATSKGLTQFGDRRQGTDRNRAAVDWIEAQLKTYGCTNTERLKYEYLLPAPPPRARSVAPAPGGGRARGIRIPTGPNEDPNAQRD